MGLYWAAFASFLAWVRSVPSIPAVIVAPVLWTALEWIRGHAFTGLPWALLGYSQYQNLPVIQIADMTGVYGVSFLAALVNAAIAETAGLADAARRRRAALSVIAAAVLFGSVWSYGAVRLGQLEKAASIPLRVGVVQANIPQDIKWNPNMRRQTIEQYARLSREVARGGVDLIVWPEAAMPFFFEEDLLFKHRVSSLAREEKTYLLFGSPSQSADKDGWPVLYNSAYLVDPSGNVVSRYDKMHLVPFGEYVPLSPVLFFINKMVSGIGDFGAGHRYTVMPLTAQDPSEGGSPDSIGGKPFGLSVAICFEVIFPEMTRRFVKEGAGLMATITNDAWFGRSAAPHQHFSMVVFRSVENRVPFVRAANTGVSGVIDADGRIRKSTGLFTEAAFRDEVRLSGQSAVYTRVGDLFAQSCVIITLFLAGIRLRKPSQR
jgi:apolipoprotein N-acyltransferase